MSGSPTSRTLDHCRRRSWPAGVVERWIPQARRRVDLLGFIDVVAVTPEGILGIQCTTMSCARAREAKIESECAANAAAWLAAGGLIEVWGWRRLLVKRGGKAVRWEVRRMRLASVELDSAGACACAVWSEVDA